jgi:hypothetical protein
VRKEFFMRDDKGVKRLSILFDSDAARSLQHIISITTRRKMQRDIYIDIKMIKIETIHKEKMLGIYHIEINTS